MRGKGCDFCFNFIIYKEMSVTFEDEGFSIMVSFCRRCFRKLKANMVVYCRGCEDLGMWNKKKYLLLNAEVLEKKPAIVYKLQSMRPSFMSIVECKLCKSERLGWLVEEKL